MCFAVLHLGDQNLSAAVRHFSCEHQDAWEEFSEKARTAIRRANLPELIRIIDSFFGGTLYSLTSLFADEQERIIQSILNQTLSEVEGSLMRIYEEHATLLHFLGEARVPAPPALALTAGFAINASLRRALEADNYDSAEIARLLRRAEQTRVVEGERRTGERATCDEPGEGCELSHSILHALSSPPAVASFTTNRTGE